MLPVSRVLSVLAAAGLLLATGSAAAQAPPTLQSGREYVRLDPPKAPAGGDKIEIIEFFYYGCPICYELEPILARWSANAPADIVLRRVPALASAAWENFARLFYTLEALGEVNRLHWPIYESFHFDGTSLSEEPVMFDWVSHNGIDGQKFADTYRSPAIQEKVAEARRMISAYGVKGVPSIAVDGRYLTSARMAGGTPELMQVVDRLIELARKERAK